jgi:viroplasmin and RNaseH domain-containing protein
LARISQQEAQSSASTQRTRGSTSAAPAFYKYYAVRRGRVCNVIYNTWAECKAQVHQFPGAEYKSFRTYVEAQGYLSIGVNRRANIFGSSDQDNSPPITRTDSDSESDTTTSTEAEPERIVVAKNNDFRDRVFFGFLLGVLFILWILRLR